MRRAHVAALAGALAAGALTATLASGAGPTPKLITLKDGPERLVTAKGSEGGDSVWVYGTAPGDLTFGADRQFTSMRTDCVVTGPAMTNAVCTDTDLETIDVSLGDGSDEVRFLPGFVSSLKRIIARGGDGQDDVRGSGDADQLEGGSGPDTLRGLRGKDDLDGGAQADRCIGGPGKDRVERCEN